MLLIAEEDKNAVNENDYDDGNRWANTKMSLKFGAVYCELCSPHTTSGNI